MNFLIILLLPLSVMVNADADKWSWPSSPNDRQQDNSRKDLLYERIDNDKSGRIRVPTSYDNQRYLKNLLIQFLTLKYSVSKQNLPNNSHIILNTLN